MKINIFFDIQDGPRGGANQFLRALRDKLIERKLYESNPLEADVVILNSYHKLNEIFSLLKAKPGIILIHRLGPIFHYHRGNAWKLYDRFLLRFASAFASGIVLQSEWSRKESGILGLEKSVKTAIIQNAADGNIFNRRGTKDAHNSNKRFSLIASSNSDNREKGLDYFEFLDKNLDFTKYKMVFVGRSKTEFTNIEYVPPQDSRKLAELLCSANAYISPVRNEACSNAILEAFACGLPVIALDNSSNPELIGTAGELFRSKNDLLEKIERVRTEYTRYVGAIKRQSVSDVTDQYVAFAEDLISMGTRTRALSALRIYSLAHLFVRWFVLFSDKFHSPLFKCR